MSSNKKKSSTFDLSSKVRRDAVRCHESHATEKSTSSPAMTSDISNIVKKQKKKSIIQHDDRNNDSINNKIAQLHEDKESETRKIKVKEGRAEKRTMDKKKKDDDNHDNDFDKGKQESNRMKEQLSKLVDILKSSKDREEKLEALRLISEIADNMPDVGIHPNESSFGIDEIPLPLLPLRNMDDIPLPTDPPPNPSSRPKTDNPNDSLKKPDSTFHGPRRNCGSEEAAVTKTRLGVVTLLKKTSNKLQVRHSLNELMSAKNKSKLLKRKTGKSFAGEAIEAEDARGEGQLANGNSRRAEIQQRINAWKEELLRDMSKDPKRKKLNVSLLDMPSKSDINCIQKEVLMTDSISGKPLQLAKPMESDVTKVRSEHETSTTNRKTSLLDEFSSPVLSFDGKKYQWPMEMIKHTLNMPSLSYSCNPLYFEFPSHSATERKLSSTKNSNSCSKMSGRLQNPNSQSTSESNLDSKKLLTPHEKLTGIPKEDDPPSRNAPNDISYMFDDEDDNQTNAAKWDTSDSESEQKQAKESSRSSKHVDSNPDRELKRNSRDYDRSSRSSSNYSYMSRGLSEDSCSSRSRLRSYSSSCGSGRSSRNHRRSYRSYSRSSRYSRSSSRGSSNSYSSYTSSDSYYSSRSRSRRRKRRWRSRSREDRSRSRDRFGRRLSRSSSSVSRKKPRSSSKESKRIISHKVLSTPSTKISTLPLTASQQFVNKIKVEAVKASQEHSSTYSIVSFTTPSPSSLNIPLPNKSTHGSSLAQSTPICEPVFIGPTLPLNHPLSVTQDIPLPLKELLHEEKFQHIGPNDPLVFKTKLPATTLISRQSTNVDIEVNSQDQSEKDPSSSFIIPPEQAERYRALRLQAEKHARKVMGGMTEEEEAEEEEIMESMEVALESSNLIGNGGNPQQQLVEELYLEQMASLMAQQQQQQLLVNAQAPVGRLVHILGGQQNVASTQQVIPLVQVGGKVMQAIPQAGAPLILTNQNAGGHIAAATLLGSPTPSPVAGGALIQMQTEDVLQTRAMMQQTRIELSEKALPERQEWVQIVQIPQHQPQPQHLILTHQLHPQAQMGLPMIHRPNIILGAARKTPTLIQLPTGPIVSPAFIGAQQLFSAQPAQQVALPFLIGANGQVLVPKFIR